MSKKRSNRRPYDTLPILFIVLLILICILIMFIVIEYRTSKESVPEQPTTKITKEKETTTIDTNKNKQPETNAPEETTKKAKSKKNTNEETTTKKLAATDKNFFKNSLFIGDSRTDGLYMFSGIESGTFYSLKGLTTSTLDTNKFVDDDGTKKTVLEALDGKNYDKIFIALGMNELGYNVDTFINSFKENLREIRELQPKAKIYIQSIIQITKSKNDSHSYFKKETVNAFNVRLKKLANNKSVFYIDLNPSLVDGNGYLKSEASSDGVHLAISYYKVWLDDLITYFSK